MTITRRRFLHGSLAGFGLASLGCQGPIVLGSGGAGSVRVGFMQPPGMEGLVAGSELHPNAALFEMDDERARRVLARALRAGGDFAELFLEQHERDVVSLADGRVEVSAASLERGASVRVVVGGEVGHAHTESLREEDLLAAAEAASRVARGAAREPSLFTRSLEIPSRFPVGWSPSDYPLVDKMKLLRRVAAAAQEGAEAPSELRARLASARRRILVYDSEGLVASDDRPGTELDCQILIRRGARQGWGRAARGGRRDQGFLASGQAPEEIAREALGRAREACEALPPPTGELPVVLAPGLVGPLLVAAAAQRRAELGAQEASPLCTIVDDGTLPQAPGSLTVDDEGSLVRRTVLVEAGLRRAHLHDRLSGVRAGLASTGNARRLSFRELPAPRATNLLLLPGPHESAELFAGIPRGLYVVATGGFQLDAETGDFALEVSQAHLIEEGRVTSPVTACRLAGRAGEALRGVDRVGAERDTPFLPLFPLAEAQGAMPQACASPHVRIAGIGVSAPA